MAITKVTNSLVATNAIQGTLIADNAITSVHIAQNQVTAVQIPDGSITSTQIAANSIDTAELVTGSIDTIHIGNDQVTTAKIADLNVTTGKIANNAITSAKIPDGSITATQLSSSTAPTFGNITTTGSLRGPASFTIDPAAVGDNTGTVVIAGSLQVDGTTTTVNSTTLSVADKNIVIASGAADAAAANDAGLTVTGASATLLYKSSGDKWSFNKPLDITGNLLLDVDNAEINLKSGAGTTSGAVNWTFNTTGTDYASIKLPYATRATTGFHIDSGYPITVDATTRINFAISGNNRFRITNTDFEVGTTPIIDLNRNLTNIGTISSGAITSSGYGVFTNGNIDPDSFTSYAGGIGNIADGSGWGARGLFVHGGGAGDAAAIAHNGDNLYFGIQNGSATNSMATWMSVTPARVVNMSGAASVTLPNTTAGTISSGAITSSGNITAGNNGNINIPTASSGNANLSFDGTDFTIVSNSSSANLKLQTYSQDTLTIASNGNLTHHRGTASFAGNVGIAAAASLRFNGTGDSSHAVGYDSTVDGSFIRGQNGIRVLTGTSGGTERMRIDSNGIVYFGSNGSTADPRINRHSNGYDYLNSGDSRWLKVGASSGHTNVAFQDGSGGITVFETAGAEAMRINSDGDLLLGGITAAVYSGSERMSLKADGTGAGLGIQTITASSQCLGLFNSDAGGTRHFIRFAGGTGGPQVGSVTNVSSTTSYNTTSDYRLKENITYEFNALERLVQLKPARFNFIADGTDRVVDGFIAHEVSDVVPEAVAGEKDAVKDDGTIDPQGMDASKLVPLLTKAIQELKTELDAAKARITDLEG